jgi:hypothetical protein
MAASTARWADSRGHGYDLHVKANNEKTPHSGGIGDLSAAAAARRRADRELAMSERLARVHVLSKQIGTIKGAARAS